MHFHTTPGRPTTDTGWGGLCPHVAAATRAFPLAVVRGRPGRHLSYMPRCVAGREAASLLRRLLPLRSDFAAAGLFGARRIDRRASSSRRSYVQAVRLWADEHGGFIAALGGCSADFLPCQPLYRVIASHVRERFAHRAVLRCPACTCLQRYALHDVVLQFDSFDSSRAQKVCS